MKENAVALVSGAAQGIGKAIAGKLIEKNYFTVMVDIDDEAGRKAAGGHGDDRCIYFHCDISAEKEVKKLFRAITSAYGKLDVLINNAAIIRDNTILKMPEGDFDDVIRVNLKGTWLMCREAAAIMKERKYGRIINISSRGWLGNAGQTNYAASKAGIIGMTRVLALELGRHNIMVNAIAPGAIDTPMTRNLPPDTLRKLIEAQPTKSLGRPEDVAHLAVFLADSETRFITGQTIYVDGGKSIGAGI